MVGVCYGAGPCRSGATVGEGDLGPLGHPDHLRVLLAQSTRRPCLAPSNHQSDEDHLDAGAEEDPDRADCGTMGEAGRERTRGLRPDGCYWGGRCSLGTQLFRVD